MNTGKTTMPEEIPLPDRPDLPQVPIPSEEPNKVPEFSTAVEARPGDIVNPIHLAFRKTLLPILLQNTKSVREAMKVAKPIAPQAMEFVKHVQNWIGTAESSALRTFGILFDMLTQASPGTGIGLLTNKGKNVNHFMPLSVVVPMKIYANHEYMLRMPHIVFRVDGDTVKCVTPNGTDDATVLNIVGAKCIPASDEEIFACVDELTPTQIASMMIHPYFRPVLHSMLGVSDGEDEDSDVPPAQEQF